MSTTGVTGSVPTPLLQTADTTAPASPAIGATTSRVEPPPLYAALEFGQTLGALGVTPPGNVDDSDAVLATLSLQLDKLFAQSRDADASSVAARITSALTQLRAMADAITTLNADRAAAATKAQADQSSINQDTADLTATQADLATAQADAAQAQKDLSAATTPAATAAAQSKLNAANMRISTDNNKIAQLVSQIAALKGDLATQTKRVNDDTTQINSDASLSSQIGQTLSQLATPKTEQNDTETNRSDVSIATNLTHVAARADFIATQNSARQLSEFLLQDLDTQSLVDTQSAQRTTPDSSNVDTTIVQTDGLVQANRDPNLQTVRGLAQLLLRDKLDDFARSDRIPGAIATLLNDFTQVAGTLSELSVEAAPPEAVAKGDRVQIPG